MSRRSGNCVRCCLVVFAVVSALCVSGPAIYWKFKKSLSLKTASLNSCSPCICDCAPPLSLLKIAPGMIFIGQSFKLWNNFSFFFGRHACMIS
ncbi:unnamed protein product [Coffea canephora]|uniref:Uncharacterized protein n=1 Tax=Coffea canephora TaxID=49390 RepID=A0A068UPQ9_COFCA|nr:unnamed protein product [Coffea canephora]